MTQLYTDSEGRTAERRLKGTSGKTYGSPWLYNAKELAAMLADGISEYVAPPAPPAPPAPDADSATRLQLIEEAAERLMSDGVTTLEDALFAAMTPHQERRFMGADYIEKTHQLVIPFLKGNGFDDAWITGFFNSANKR